MFEQQLLRLKRVDTTTARRHSVLEMEFLRFLESLGIPRPTLYDATPRDVVYYLLSKDATGRTVVHEPGCSIARLPTLMSRRSAPLCDCPIAAGAYSTEVTRGSLQAVFREAGLAAPWNPAACTGNPADSMFVNQFVRRNLRYQATAGVHANQAPLIGHCVFSALMDTVLAQGDGITTLSGMGKRRRMLIVLQDALCFSLLWYSGLRGKDALRLQSNQVTLGITSGAHKQLRINVLITKTRYEPNRQRTVTIDDDGSRYNPIHLFERRQRFALACGLMASPGAFLSRVTGRAATVSWGPTPTTTTLRARLRVYLRQARLPDIIRVHSFRASFARLLRDSGVPDEEICRRIDWTKRWFDHYTAPRPGREVLRLTQARALFAIQLAAALDEDSDHELSDGENLRHE
jgi:hypothetical protein